MCHALLACFAGAVSPGTYPFSLLIAIVRLCVRIESFTYQNDIYILLLLIIKWFNAMPTMCGWLFADCLVSSSCHIMMLLYLEVLGPRHNTAHLIMYKKATYSVFFPHHGSLCLSLRRYQCSLLLFPILLCLPSARHPYPRLLRLA